MHINDVRRSSMLGCYAVSVHTFTQAACPPAPARCSGDLPHSSWTSAYAPRANNAAAAGASPAAAAQCSSSFSESHLLSKLAALSADWVESAVTHT